MIAELRDGAPRTHRSQGCLNLKGFHKYLLAERVLTKDPDEPPRGRKAWQTLPRFLTQQEMEALLQQPSEGDESGFEIARFSSFSTPPACESPSSLGLNMNDVDWETGSGKRLRQRKQAPSVPLGRDCARAAQRFTFPLDSVCSLGRARITCLSSGAEGRLTRQGLWKMVKEYGRLAGIDYITPHMLRHQLCDGTS
jgi:integrase/recombinase XerD